MPNRISNKDKQAKFSDYDEVPSRWLKRQTIRHLRREPLEDSGEDHRELRADRASDPGSLDRRALRKQKDRCPVCEAKLEKNGKGTRFQRVCKSCGAARQKDLFCPSCSTHRVWGGRLGRWCKGCGKEFAG